MRYLSSSAHGTVPILRAGGETYLWMPATSGGENVWRHVLTNGTSPGSARKRIALKAGGPTNSESRLSRISARARQQSYSSFQKLQSSGRSVN
jgi:hypothetical protein